MAQAPPIGEKGHGGASLIPWSGLADPIEETPELMWPNNIRIYEQMRRTDSQLAGIYRAVTLPIRRFKWHIIPNGASDRTVEELAEDLGLPIEGDDGPRNRARSRGRFSHDRHLRHALLQLIFGHMFFEQDGDIVDGRWRLKKLAPRMPSTISKVNVARDGGLVSIEQYGTGVPGEPPSVELKVNRLVAYVNEQEGGNWFGTSILRVAYKHWLIKDRLLRVDAMKHERNGLGVPIIEAPPNASARQVEALDQVAQDYKAGESAGGALPSGARLRLVGTEGSIPDTLASIRYHDEQESKIMLTQFLDLGTTGAGNRALGESFIDFFSLALDAVAKEYAGVTTEHVLEDWVDWNDGDSAPSPILGYETSGDPELEITELVELIKAGSITVDDETENWIRERYRVPEYVAPPKPPGSPVLEPGVGQPAIPLPAASRRQVVRGALKLPNRTLRRDPFEHEVEARTDFAAMERQFTTTQKSIVDKWKDLVRADQIDELVALVDQAAQTGSLTTLASIQATPAGAELIAEAMLEMAEASIANATAEIVAQGVAKTAPPVAELAAGFEARASATQQLLANSLSEAAGRKALSLAGGGMSSAEIGAGVRSHLEALSDTYLETQLGGTLSQAQNTARRFVFNDDAPKEVYASELLDAATCDACASIDGQEYDTLTDAESDYPTGGFAECAGGERCRGTLVAIYDDEADPSEGDLGSDPPPNTPTDAPNLGVTPMTPEELVDKAIAEDLVGGLEREVWGSPGHPVPLSKASQPGDLVLKHIAGDQGFTDLPTVVSKSEMDVLIAEGKPDLYRGVTDNSSRPTTFVEDFRSGEYFAGGGIHGSGTYAAGVGSRTGATAHESFEFATGYAGGGKADNLLRMTLSDDANMVSSIDLNQLTKDVDEYLGRKIAGLDRYGVDSDEYYALNKLRTALADPGRVAAYQGYDGFIVWKDDAIYLDSGEMTKAVLQNGEYIVLNRSKVIVQSDMVTDPALTLVRPVPTTHDELKAYLRDQDMGYIDTPEMRAMSETQIASLHKSLDDALARIDLHGGALRPTQLEIVSKTDGTVAFVSAGEPGLLTVNLEHLDNVDIFEGDFLVADSLEDVLVHEASHLYDIENLEIHPDTGAMEWAGGFEEFLPPEWIDQEYLADFGVVTLNKTAIRKDLSVYASSDYAELWAEISLKVSKGTAGPRVQKIYDDLMEA